VKAVELRSQEVDAINRGIAPVHEPVLEELIGGSGTLLHATQNVEEAVHDSDVTFVGVRYVRLGFGDYAEHPMRVSSSAQ